MADSDNAPDNLSSISLNLTGWSCDSLLLYFSTFWNISTGPINAYRTHPSFGGVPSAMRGICY